MKTKKLLAGVLAAAALATGGALAAEGISTTINVFKGGITVTKDGAALDLKDGAGNPVEAMIYNGTTYLPVRAVAEASNLEVGWDQATRTVILGGKSATYLDELAPLGFVGTMAADKYETVGSPKYNGKTYTSAIDLVCNTNTTGEMEGENSVVSLSYAPNGAYTKFVGKLICTWSSDHIYNGTQVQVLGDNRELYRSPLMTDESRAVDLELDLTGVNTLEFRFTTEDNNYYNWSDPFCQNFRLLDARLVK